MFTIDDQIITDYAGFVSGSFDALLPLIGMTVGVFLAFAIFERIVRAILKALR